MKITPIEWGVIAAIALLLPLIFLAAQDKIEKKNQFLTSCASDGKKLYECEALYSKSQEATEIANAISLNAVLRK